MMEIDNDKLLRQYFAANRQEIADRGFSRRVMQHIPDRRVRLIGRLWSAFCWLLIGILFIAFDGITLIWNTLSNILTSSVAPNIEQLNPISIYIAVVVLIILGCRKIASRV
ncbi:MAG: DUF5056 domain-containing protein [Prevotellaceae bacterium]|jgi:hypothetical protein|nr:DUF5056 domain-containing protein [Prevotellaceae bacterium]